MTARTKKGALSTAERGTGAALPLQESIIAIIFSGGSLFDSHSQSYSLILKRASPEHCCLYCAGSLGTVPVPYTEYMMLMLMIWRQKMVCGATGCYISRLGS